MRLPPRKHTIAVPAGNHLPHPRDWSSGFHPLIELQAHTQVPRHDLVPRNSVVKRVKPVQQHLIHGKRTQLIIALRRQHLKLSLLWSILEALDCS